MTVFLGIYKAIYNYEPQTPEELAIQEDDLLYLLEKSDVDDWWTVKKRVIGSDAEEPSGLIPSNYIEEATVIKQVKALYDYHDIQNPDEELVFNENDVFDVFDDQDQDWLLVKSIKITLFGFIPGNYVEEVSGGAASTAAPPITSTFTPAAAPATVATNTVDISALPPPPQHNARSELAEKTKEKEDVPPSMPTRPTGNNKTQSYDDDEEEEAPPAMPDRYTTRAADRYDDHEYSNTRNRSRSRVSHYEPEEEEDNDFDQQRSDQGFNSRSGSSNLHTWNVSEIDGRKKRKMKISIGNGKIFYTPQKGNPEEWTFDKLISYDNEKKHLFLEFVDPYKSLEVHTGNNETCSEILSYIGEFKGASRDQGIREVEMASKSKKRGNVILDFEAEANDELSVRVGQVVYIIDDQKSRDWWMCEAVDTGKRGIIPAQFIEPISEKSSHGGGLFKSLKRMTKSSHKSSSSNWQDDESENKGNRSRSGSRSSRKRSSSNARQDQTELPNPKKTRIWEDRSGTFKVEAQFIGCKEGKVHLHKSNGVKIAVPADKLSNEDLVYVERLTGFSLDKYKQGRGGDSNRLGSDPRESERERRRRLRELDEKERDRKLREREIDELQKARTLLDQERSKLQDYNNVPPSKPPRPNSMSGSNRSGSQSGSQANANSYDWFEFFLNAGIDVTSCQRYTSNFDKERITEDMLPDFNDSMLRTLGLREGDIVRVMKYVDTKLGRDSQKQVPAATGNMFSEADGSLKNNNDQTQPPVSTQLLPQQNIATQPNIVDDDSWTVKPAAKSEVASDLNKSEFTGSMQDLLDLKPLEPKKADVAPTASVVAPAQATATTATTTTTTTTTPLTSSITGGPLSLAPLDPFKTGGHNLLPISTGFIMMPIATGGAMVPITTGGAMIPQTTFGAQLTGGVMPLQKTGGMIQPVITGGAMPATSFNLPPSGTILPVQKTANGLVGSNAMGGMMPMQNHLTGSMMPQTSFGAPQLTGGMMPMQNQLTGGMMPRTSFGAPQMTGGMMPQTSFGGAQLTGNMMQQPMMQQPMMQQSMMQQQMMNQATGGFQPKSQFGMELQKTGNAMNQLPVFNNNTSGITQGMQNMSMQQPQVQPLQNQPTGFGFGNGPQQTSGQANLMNASASNPFGF
ncbi:hypothetical protein TPHA_0K01600 [Tetrapisispora phaffii CBS 4417]|uniref:Actin cytoskeleton-regulatory complex protein SLA1 n=1 Tax=Tetrapisispora phaffii (strain ATCC 24235 / CBS 4417 / NBRC 1672 / NRRL Y-8282 / UCD 70-5) TaxID=1071381 RepID=G8BZG5_TETPH|nr:hypothetical protein TPHA_0K01600 [Tetrapisispora phaffii CBS 4417]CCE65293.1 hypothetical protein TPHA_0K01600 [Tetrapisispora phaffii CBS 4417]